MALRRINKDYDEFIKENLSHISAEPESDNIFKWCATIEGPTGSPYEDGRFDLLIEFPTNYPMEPPKVRFATSLYHPNVSTQGEICTGILKGDWNPSYNITRVLVDIYSLLSNPVTENPLNTDAASVLTSNREQFIANAKAWTKKHAM